MPSIEKKCNHQWFSISTDNSCQKCAKCSLIVMPSVDGKELVKIKG